MIAAIIAAGDVCPKTTSAQRSKNQENFNFTEPEPVISSILFTRLYTSIRVKSTHNLSFSKNTMKWHIAPKGLAQNGFNKF